MDLVRPPAPTTTRPYAVPTADVRLALRHVAGYERVEELPALRHAALDTVVEVVAEAGRLAVDRVLPLTRSGDAAHSRLVDGRVVPPPGFRSAYRAFVDGGWFGVSAPEEHGGGGLPYVTSVALQEVLNACDPSFALCPMLTQGAMELLLAFGTPEQQARYLPHLVAGTWTGTMNLTEPGAGSDVGALQTTAVRAEDGTWHISGTKIFITWGDHDLTENIVHLVLARTPGAPAGTRGVSCFLVPRRLIHPDGSLGDDNRLGPIGVEDKVGIRASPTCTMAYDGAVGELVGDVGGGMRAMFVMMKRARLAMGAQGLGIAEAAVQLARTHAAERIQGTPPLGTEDQDPMRRTIVDHPDIRRLLLACRAQVAALRGLVLLEAVELDLAQHHPDPSEREAALALADILTPIVKAWGTELGVEGASAAMQVLGGMGYVEDTGAGQLWRDARIGPIYEGTNGIQAIDLVTRHVLGPTASAFDVLLDTVASTAKELGATAACAAVGDALAVSLDHLRQVTASLREHSTDRPAVLAAATPFLHLAATVLAGWSLGRAALGGLSDLDRGAAGSHAESCRVHATLAAYFAAHVLPATAGMVPTILAGADGLYGLPPGVL